jgi:hypothetical protein
MKPGTATEAFGGERVATLTAVTHLLAGVGTDLD